MEKIGAGDVNMAAGGFNPQKHQVLTLSAGEQATVSAICNRLSRMLGIMDREGLQKDIAIVQAHCPLNLEALAAAPERIFVEELLTILDATDRVTGALVSDFESRFKVDGLTATIL
ncbi:MAG: hypothetical protein AAGG55_15985 [Pseudomonadota bacterium]